MQQLFLFLLRSPSLQCIGNPSTVTELVVRTITANQKEQIATIVIVPWIIDPTSDLQPFLRLHYMGMDAKSELVQAVYHQLLVLSAAHGDHVQQIQFISRIIAAPKPLWVIDFIGPLGFSAAHINSHFFGNSTGSSTTVEFDGIPTRCSKDMESRGLHYQASLTPLSPGLTYLSARTSHSDTLRT